MEKFIKETALKVEDFLNSAASKCERETNVTTAALKAEFALGKYFALMDIIKTYDIDLYISVAKSTREARNKLSNIVNNIRMFDCEQNKR